MHLDRLLRDIAEHRIGAAEGDDRHLGEEGGEPRPDRPRRERHEQRHRGEPEAEPERQRRPEAARMGARMGKAPRFDQRIGEAGGGAGSGGVRGRGAHRAGQGARQDESRQPGGGDDGRERNGEQEQREERPGGDPDHRGAPQRASRQPGERLHDDGEHRAFDAVEKPLDQRDMRPQRIERAQPQHDRRAGQDEEQSGDQPAAPAAEQPADIGGELLRLGAGQQHAVVERVQEPRLADPALFVHQDAVHQRDLRRRTAEAEQPDAGEGADDLAEAGQGGGHARMDAAASIVP